MYIDIGLCMRGSSRGAIILHALPLFVFSLWPLPLLSIKEVGKILKIVIVQDFKENWNLALNIHTLSEQRQAVNGS